MTLCVFCWWGCRLPVMSKRNLREALPVTARDSAKCNSLICKSSHDFSRYYAYHAFKLFLEHLTSSAKTTDWPPPLWFEFDQDRSISCLYLNIHTQKHAEMYTYKQSSTHVCKQFLLCASPKWISLVWSHQVCLRRCCINSLALVDERNPWESWRVYTKGWKRYWVEAPISRASSLWVFEHLICCGWSGDLR